MCSTMGLTRRNGYTFAAAAYTGDAVRDSAAKPSSRLGSVLIFCRQVPLSQ